MTERLRIEPTDAVEGAGSGRPSATSRRSMSIWRLATDERQSDLAEHLVELLDRVEPMREQLVALANDGYVMDWWCSVESLDTERAIELSPALLARLASLPVPLLIDAWTVDPDNE